MRPITNHDEKSVRHRNLVRDSRRLKWLLGMCRDIGLYLSPPSTLDPARTFHALNISNPTKWHRLRVTR